MAGVIRVYRLEIQSVMLVFSVQLCETVAPLHFSLVQTYPLPPFPVWISILYTCIQCVRGGGYGFYASDRWTPAAKSLLQVNCFRWRHFALPSIFYVCQPSCSFNFLDSAYRHPWFNSAYRHPWFNSAYRHPWVTPAGWRSLFPSCWSTLSSPGSGSAYSR